ncbi:MAG: hypothetical protein HY704_07535 [Gemmatimonadetes bacterium]|nr:hypothetical protein [Gemmatimonadota bacterium]
MSGTPSDQATPLVRDRLISSALEGKSKATHAYDAITWKIRAGYVAILYGSLALVLGTSGIDQIGQLTQDPARSITILLLLVGFSLSAFYVDSIYIHKKTRVTVSRDLLVSVSLKTATVTDLELERLLQIAGDMPDKLLPVQAREALRLRRAENLRELLWLYVTPPTLAAIVFALAFVVGS